MRQAGPADFRRGISKSALVYEALKTQIVDLALEPGTRIDKAEICDRLSVSRQPVAEAIARLAEDRLVEVEPQKGTFVARIRFANVAEAAFVRRALEVATVREIAPCIDAEGLERLARILGYQATALAMGDRAEFYALDLRFHAALIERLGNRRLADFVDSARSELERARRMMLPKPGRNSRALAEHRSVMAGLAAHNPDAAAAAMRDHLDQSMKELQAFAAERPELFAP